MAKKWFSKNDELSVSANNLSRNRSKQTILKNDYCQRLIKILITAHQHQWEKGQFSFFSFEILNDLNEETDQKAKLSRPNNNGKYQQFDKSFWTSLVKAALKYANLNNFECGAWKIL